MPREIDKLTFNDLEYFFEGAYIVDNDRKFIYWNQAASDITGYSKEEIIGKSCHDNVLNHLTLEGIQLCLEGCPKMKVLQTKVMESFDAFIKHKSGYRIKVKVRTFPIIDQGEVLGIGEIFVPDDHQTFMAPKQLRDQRFDQMTHLYDRTYVDDYLAYIINQPMTEYASVGVIILDIDNFEEINQIYGVVACDRLLELLGLSYKNCFKSADCIGRYKQDEVIFVFSDMTHEHLEAICEQIRIVSESTALKHDTLRDIDVTVSVGASLVHAQDTIEKIYDRTYRNMKKSKQKGGNIITVR